MSQGHWCISFSLWRVGRCLLWDLKLHLFSHNLCCQVEFFYLPLAEILFYMTLRLNRELELFIFLIGMNNLHSESNLSCVTLKVSVIIWKLFAHVQIDELLLG